jgi:hypothetical protein
MAHVTQAPAEPLPIIDGWQSEPNLQASHGSFDFDPAFAAINSPYLSPHEKE